MTDAEKIMTLRDALSGVKYKISKPGWWGHIAESVDEALAATAPEPEKPWWDDARKLCTIGFGEPYNALYHEGYPLTKFYAAAPLMAKALLAFVKARDTDDDEHEAEHAARAAIKAAGVSE